TKKLAKLQAEAVNCRAESLGEVKTLLGLMAEAKGEELARLRLRAKTRIRWLVNEIWVLVEKTNHVLRVAHVQVFLRNGARRYFCVQAREEDPDKPGSPIKLNLRDVDLREYAQAAHGRTEGT